MLTARCHLQGVECFLQIAGKIFKAVYSSCNLQEGFSRLHFLPAACRKDFQGCIFLPVGCRNKNTPQTLTP
jgi:hypothetical protein